MSETLSIEKAIAQLKNEKGPVFKELMRRGTLLVEYFVPKKTDLAKPHLRDEIYIIASGYSTLYREGQRIMCFTGDVLFVAAGMDHRFENYSEDFATWVMFYGPGAGVTGSGELLEPSL